MRPRIFAATAAAIAATALVACSDVSPSGTGGPEADQHPSYVELREGFDPEAEFSYAHFYPPSSFDPMTSASGLDQTYLAPIYDRLIYRTPDDTLEPMLATEWVADDDQTTLVITLRDGLTFTDGVAFDAEAVKTNLDRYRGEGSTIRQELSQVVSIDVTGPLEVTIHTEGGVGALLTALSARPGMMVSPDSIDAGNIESTPVGIGPYQALEVVPGESVTLTRTDDYWDPSVQRVAGMRLVGMTEAQTRLNAVRTGQITAASIEPTQTSAAEQSDLGLLAGPTPLFWFFAVNTSVEPFDDPNVRAALNLAINREAISQGLFNGYCKPQVQLWPENSFAFDEDFGSGLDHAPYDPERAAALLEDSDYTPGESFETVLTNSTTSVQIAETLQSDLAAIGISIDLRPVPSGGILEYFAIDKTIPTTLSAYTGSPDPASVIDRNLTSTAPYNPGGLDYPTLTEHMVAGANAVDLDERKVAYANFSNEFVEAQSHLIPICMTYDVTAYDQSVSNIHAASDYTDLRGVAVDD